MKVNKKSSRTRHKHPGKIQVPVGVEKVLYIAAGDEDFKKKLLGDRQGAIGDCGTTLRPSESAMLSAITNDVLLTMIDNIVPQNPRRRKFMGLVAAAAASLAAGTASTACVDKDNELVDTAGTGPDTDTIDTDYPLDTDTLGMDGDTEIDGGPDGSI